MEGLSSVRLRHHGVGPGIYFPLALLLSAHPFLPTTLSAPSSKRSSVSSSYPAMATAKAQPPPPPPPVAKKVKHEMEMFGDVRIDNYYWLRDDSRSDPQVLSYLRDENAYTDLLMSGTKHLENQIYAEIRGRIKEDDISVPLRKGPYYYYERTLEGKEYVQHCRRLVPNVEVPPSVYETMPTGPSAPPEHVILDENIKAQEHAYYSIGAFKISPNSKLVAYAEDTKGDEIYTVYVIDAETRAPVGKPIVGVTPYLEWVGDEALLYITMDETLRPDKVWLHKLETDQSSDSCLYHEKDNMFSVDLEASESKKFVFVGSESKTTRFIFYLDVSKPGGLMVLTPRLDGIDTSASHRGNHFFIKRRSDEFFNSEVVACPLDNISETTICVDAHFQESRLSLLDRGFIFAIAHIRGGGEMGRQWYENGKLLKKKNTFTDFIACAEYLIEMKYCSKEKLCIEGRSAGGLLIGAVLNMRPDLFRAAFAGVPFVDVLTTMLDPTIPLTTSEWEEWGDPRKEEFYFYMKSYSPVDNIKAQNYPNILVTAGLNDPRVLYSEPAKLVAKLRDTKTDDNILLFKCEMAAGHSSKSGRFEKLQEDAFIYTFIIKSLDMVPPLGSEQN
ncbi:hypothetical protein PVL29_013808 [Vitis rotundifolia]|uniref:Prolyl endopeptidase n=1 Tax=Vitis rotundifolia TaxID=103349 RepID=A0AA39DRN4_VITRO|nr:hypothetical protein PVL29_013808 [Vitis rotundifolia]